MFENVSCFHKEKGNNNLRTVTFEILHVCVKACLNSGSENLFFILSICLCLIKVQQEMLTLPEHLISSLVS